MSATLNIKSGENDGLRRQERRAGVRVRRTRASTLTVNRGKAKVVSGNTEKRVGENQKVVVAGDAKNIDVITIPLKQREPLPDSVVATQGAAANVAFSWETLGPEQDASIEITSASRRGAPGSGSSGG